MCNVFHRCNDVHVTVVQENNCRNDVVGDYAEHWAIQNFDEAAAIAYINTFNGNSANHGTIDNNYDCQLTFNPLDKMVELYERMLQQQREMIEKLERLMERK